MLPTLRRLTGSIATQLLCLGLIAVLAPLVVAAAGLPLATSLAVAAGTSGLLLLLWRRIAFRLELLDRAASGWAREEWRQPTGAGDELAEMAARLDAAGRELAARNAERELDERRRAALLRVAK